METCMQVGRETGRLEVRQGDWQENKGREAGRGAGDRQAGRQASSQLVKGQTACVKGREEADKGKASR